MNARLSLIPLLFLVASAGSAAAPAKSIETESLRLACDAINIDGQIDVATAKELGPAHSLDAAAAVLERHNVKFTRGRGVMTLTDAPSAIVREIYQLPQGEPIVLPNGKDTTICVPRPSADTF